jgi:hypothetical protein
LQGEALLALLAELDITQQSYSQHLQALLMDVSLTGWWFESGLVIKIGNQEQTSTVCTSAFA